MSNHLSDQFLFIRKLAGLKFRVDSRSVHHHLKLSAFRLDKLGSNAECLLDCGGQTGRPWLVVSPGAVGNCYLHHSLLCADVDKKMTLQLTITIPATTPHHKSAPIQNRCRQRRQFWCLLICRKETTSPILLSLRRCNSKPSVNVPLIVSVERRKSAREPQLRLTAEEPSRETPHHRGKFFRQPAVNFVFESLPHPAVPRLGD